MLLWLEPWRSPHKRVLQRDESSPRVRESMGHVVSAIQLFIVCYCIIYSIIYFLFICLLVYQSIN